MAAQASSTCIQSAQGILTGFGAPIVSAYDQTALTATGNIVVPTVTPGGIGITRGKIRVQIYTLNAATTIAMGGITCTDGTTTVQVGATNRVAATAAGTQLDFLTDFIVGIIATSFTIPITLAGSTTTATVNTEIFGTV